MMVAVLLVMVVNGRESSSVTKLPVRMPGAMASTVSTLVLVNLPCHTGYNVGKSAYNLFVKGFFELFWRAFHCMAFLG